MMGTEDVCGWQWKRLPIDAGSPGRSGSLGYVTPKLSLLGAGTKTEGEWNNHILGNLDL